MGSSNVVSSASPDASFADTITALEDYVETSGEFDTLLDNQDPQPSPETPVSDDPVVENQDPEAPLDPDADPIEGDDTDPEVDPEADPDGEGDPAENITTLEAIANHFEVETEDVLDLLEVEGLDGTPIPIGQALDSWRAGENTLATRRTELETEFSSARAEYDEQATGAVKQLHTMTQGMITKMKDQYNPERLASLRENDPDRYLQVMEERHELEAMINGAIHGIGQVADQHQKSSAQDMKQLLRDEGVKLLRAKPEWRDPKVYQDFMDKGTEYLLNDIGFTTEEIDNLNDHRIILVLEDAVRGRAILKGSNSKNIDVLRKKGLKRPGIGLKGQTRRDPENPQTKSRDEARAKLKRTGGAKDAAALIEGLL